MGLASPIDSCWRRCLGYFCDVLGFCWLGVSPLVRAFAASHGPTRVKLKCARLDAWFSGVARIKSRLPVARSD